MTLLSKKQFAIKCKIQTKHLSTYISRGKVLVTEDNFIDDEDPINYAFLIKKGYTGDDDFEQHGDPKESKPAKKRGRPPKPKAEKKSIEKKKPGPKPKKEKTDKPEMEVSKKEEAQPKKPEPKPEPAIDPEIVRRQKELADIEMQTKLANLRKAEHDEKLRQISLEKQQRLLMPTELVSKMIESLSEEILNSVHESNENMIVIFGNKAKFTSEDTANMRRKLNNDLNRAFESAVENAKRKMETIIDEYSEQRGVGQRQLA